MNNTVSSIDETHETLKPELQLTKGQIRRNRAFVFLTLVSTLTYLVWRVGFTLPFGFGIISMIAGLTLLVFESMGLLESMIHYFNMFNIREPMLPAIPPETFPDVDIYIATYQEPVELLYKTINGCKHIEYPDKSRVHIHLCDDGRRDEARELAEKTGINYIYRADNKGAKAGNLNNAMTTTAAPLLLILDADMIPKHDILLKMVPYFVDEEIKNKSRPEKKQVHIGFVQSPQAFYNPDLFQFNLFSEGRIPNEQDYFYRDIQISRNASNSPIFGGSNALISRKAIEDIGGFFTGSITEDFATGCLIQKAGYRCYAISDVLASGLSPTDLPSLIQQRIRWARGCISTGKQMHLLTAKGLTLWQRLNYFAAIWYWYSSLKRLVYVMGPIMFLVFGYVVLKCTLAQMLAFWLPMYVLNSVTLNMLSQNIRNIKWTSVYETVMFPFMLIPVILESLGVSLKKFKVTKKDRSNSNTSQQLVYAVPFILLSALSVIGLIRGFSLFLDSGVMSPIVTLFWLSSNFFNLIMAVFFMLGRKLFRNNERVVAEIPCTLFAPNHQSIPVSTIDFSEDGVSVYLDNPLDIDEHETVDIAFRTSRYRAHIKAAVVHVGARGQGWKYSFRIEDYYQTYDDYLCILYDRPPTLPSHISKTQSVFEDLKLNITSRKQITYFQNRHYPRISLNETLRCPDGRDINIVNYNYRCALIRLKDAPDELVLDLFADIQLRLGLLRTGSGGLALYDVRNYGDLLRDPVKNTLLNWWIQIAIDNMRKEESYEPDIEDVLVREMLGFMPGRDTASEAESSRHIPAAKSNLTIPEGSEFPWRLVFMPAMAILAIGVLWYFSNVLNVVQPPPEENIPALEETSRNVILPGYLSRFLVPQAVSLSEGTPRDDDTATGVLGDIFRESAEIPELGVYVLDNDTFTFDGNTDEFADDEEAALQLEQIAEQLRQIPSGQTVRIDGHTLRMGYYYGEMDLAFRRVNKVAHILIDNWDFERSQIPYGQRCGWGSYVPDWRSPPENRRIIIATPVLNVSHDDIAFPKGEYQIPDSQKAADALDMTAATLKALLEKNPEQAFRVEGPVEKAGSQSEALGLSLSRARQIANELVVRGVPASSLYVVGRSIGIPSCGATSNEDTGTDIVPMAQMEIPRQ